MAKEKVDNKELEKKIAELKIELLKQPQKRKSIKREIAKALTTIQINNSGGKK